MYIAVRMKSPPQSSTSASHEAGLMHWAYHCRPCVLMPRSWMGLLYWLHNCTPHTRSRPLTSCGLVPGVPGVVFTVTGLDGPERFPAASRACTVKV